MTCTSSSMYSTVKGSIVGGECVWCMTLYVISLEIGIELNKTYTTYRYKVQFVLEVLLLVYVHCIL